MTKIEQAIQILKKHPAWSRSSLIEEIQYVCGMSAAGASTYYYNAKKAIEEEGQARNQSWAYKNRNDHAATSEAAQRVREELERMRKLREEEAAQRSEQARRDAEAMKARAREQMERQAREAEQVRQRMKEQAERLRREAEAAMRGKTRTNTNTNYNSNQSNSADWAMFEEVLRRLAEEEMRRRAREQAKPSPAQNTQKWFEVLGVSATATKAEINTAWKNLCKKHHPDLGGKVEDMQKVNIARDLGLKLAAN